MDIHVDSECAATCNLNGCFGEYGLCFFEEDNFEDKLDQDIINSPEIQLDELSNTIITTNKYYAVIQTQVNAALLATLGIDPTTIMLLEEIWLKDWIK
ncbi:hypothetical protein RCL_jg11943.t1 [Rhizophagus clarus]|uniref:Uncharacterized protein n=1 Tax=Rhizophagus clarus TaxID=94130 RepID=A0A8H3L7H0_9GLOM|nr:hypothetical protein RCL_jg11943.t1 [Rhizophagus clarus]